MGFVATISLAILSTLEFVACDEAFRVHSSYYDPANDYAHWRVRSVSFEATTYRDCNARCEQDPYFCKSWTFYDGNLALPQARDRFTCVLRDTNDPDRYSQLDYYTKPYYGRVLSCNARSCYEPEGVNFKSHVRKNGFFNFDDASATISGVYRWEDCNQRCESNADCQTWKFMDGRDSINENERYTCVLGSSVPEAGRFTEQLGAVSCPTKRCDEPRMAYDYAVTKKHSGYMIDPDPRTKQEWRHSNRPTSYEDCNSACLRDTSCKIWAFRDDRTSANLHDRFWCELGQKTVDWMTEENEGTMYCAAPSCELAPDCVDIGGHEHRHIPQICCKTEDCSDAINSTVLFAERWPWCGVNRQPPCARTCEEYGGVTLAGHPPICSLRNWPRFPPGELNQCGAKIRDGVYQRVPCKLGYKATEIDGEEVIPAGSNTGVSAGHHRATKLLLRIV